MLSLALLAPLAVPSLFEASLLSGLLGIALGGLGAAWCVADARERGLNIGSWVGPYVLLLGPLGFTLYLARYRGWRQTVIVLLAFVALAIVTLLATSFVAFWLFPDALVY
ncbi:MAG: hypothetical protein AAGG50_10255 [Bacteroidota bacterium]